MRWITKTEDAGGWRSLGPVKFRTIVGSADTDAGFAVLEFAGPEGPWTVPHLHRQMEESFFVLDGEFLFTLEGQHVNVPRGSFVLVPRGVPHTLAAGRGGGRLITLAVPGGLEAMFRELSELGDGAITDPEVRARVARRYDSVPV